MFRVFALTAPFVAITALVTLIGLASLAAAGPWLVAFLAGVGGLGTVAGSLLSGRAAPRLARYPRTGKVLLLTGWASSQVATLTVLELHAALSTGVAVVVAGVLALLSGLSLGAVTVYRRQATAQWGTTWLRYAGPTGRIGATIGTFAGVVFATDRPFWVLAVLAALPFISPLRFNGSSRAHQRDSDRSHTAGRHEARRAFMVNAAFALVAFGPLVALVAMVALTAGPTWLPAAMGVYALGAVVSPLLVRRFPRCAPVSLPGYLAWSAAANASWLLALVFPVAGMVVARLFGGVALFAVEGSADVAASRTNTFGPALAGRSFGVTGAGFLTAGVLAVTSSATVTAGLLAAAAAAAAVVTARRPAWSREACTPPDQVHNQARVLAVQAR